MSKRKQVGSSKDRTKWKHWLLNYLMGRQAGNFGNESARQKVSYFAVPDPFLAMDLCAGNGLATIESGVSSPEVMARHLAHMHTRGVPVEGYAFEKDEQTYSRLVKNLDGYDHYRLIKPVHGDSSEMVLRPRRKDQAVFIHADPNAISDMPITTVMARSFTQATTFLCTMGCNPSGIKRLERELREPWFDFVGDVTADMPSWHDAILVRLNRDASQWAYLIRSPSKWVERDLNEIAKKGTAMWPKGVEAVSLKKEPVRFNQTLRELFLTCKERDSEVA